MSDDHDDVTGGHDHDHDHDAPTFEFVELPVVTTRYRTKLGWLIVAAFMLLAAAVLVANVALLQDRANDKSRIRELNRELACRSDVSSQLDVLNAQELGLLGQTVAQLASQDRAGAQATIERMGELAPQIDDAVRARQNAVAICADK